MAKNKEWFASWFDTRYYHILYKHRDDTEAHEFIQNLVSFLKIENSRIFDSFTSCNTNEYNSDSVI